jgi:hypothetical protein
MLHSVRALRGSAIAAQDERFGFVVDLYFDDRAWTLRYVVLDTGRPMPQRNVLLEPGVIASINPGGTLSVRLTRKQVEKKPDWLTDPPVYLQHDMTPTGHRGDAHLRSSEIVMGYSVQARGGALLGHVADLLLDVPGWTLPCLVVDTGHWLPGRRVRVPASAVQDIDWIGRKVRLGVEREAILAAA